MRQELEAKMYIALITCLGIYISGIVTLVYILGWEYGFKSALIFAAQWPYFVIVFWIMFIYVSIIGYKSPNKRVGE